MPILTYLIKLPDWLSCGVNAALLMGSNDESVSGRSYRESVYEGKARWMPLRKTIDWVCSVFEDQHCRRAYYKDLSRAQHYLDRHEQYMRTNPGRFESLYAPPPEPKTDLKTNK